MFPLDPKTVHRLAAIIVDADGAVCERRSWQLEQLLVNAGWSGPPEFDGYSRVEWLREQMIARQHDRPAIERLLCRVCDSIEYDDGAAVAEQVRQRVNATLVPEQLIVTYVSGRPVLSELKADGSGASFTEPPELEQRIRQLVADRTTADVLTRRLRETRICQRGGAYTMAIIGIGSLVEGLLFALVLQHGKQDMLARDGKLVPLERVSPAMLIDVAHSLHWIQLDAKTFLHIIREFRNFVHPRKELADQPDFDSDSMGPCWSTIGIVLNDLESCLRR